ncbi:hypothetical protein [Methanomassiliicoccus luminyensis]|uniref:hypothetical protein n=1 Tax=Methanomassiliicoccus luminyensis TaxID=1080712 RepID=UPI0011C7106B|nr:hypothetical protein [Methanomassiliicoccus luminyensis]
MGNIIGTIIIRLSPNPDKHILNRIRELDCDMDQLMPSILYYETLANDFQITSAQRKADSLREIVKRKEDEKNRLIDALKVRELAKEGHPAEQE